MSYTGELVRQDLQDRPDDLSYSHRPEGAENTPSPTAKQAWLKEPVIVTKQFNFR